MKPEDYPDLDIEKYLASKGDEEALASVGVEPGRYMSERPEERSLGEGGLLVILPAPRVVYEPSVSGIQFALGWVDCGEQIGFVEALEELQQEPRARVFKRYELTILGLLEQIEELDLP